MNSNSGEMHDTFEIGGDYIMVRAMEDGVTIIGLTRGKDTKFSHTEKLDHGEIMIAQFTSNTSAMKIRGRAEVYTKFGMVETRTPQDAGRA
jgi:transcription attenuation protein (tryptophan RNA-binding attenuator protein)